jgi:hypothetical protein
LGLIRQLERLVQATNTPFALLYVADHLHWGDPTLSFCFLRALHHIHSLVFARLLHPALNAHLRMPLHRHHGMPLPRHPGMPLLVALPGGPHPQPALPLVAQQLPEQPIEQLRRQQQRDLDIHQEALRLLTERRMLTEMEKLVNGKPDELCKQLRDGPPLLRLIALQVISRRRMPVEKDLIEVLDDPDKTIRQTAREALVRIARGTDFGPSLTATKRGVAQSIERWRDWLALQQSVAPPTPTPGAAAPPKQSRAEELEARPLFLVPGDKKASKP